MTMRRSQDTATHGAHGAVQVRYKLGLADESPVCAYELAADLDVNVRFQGGHSFGGMYDNQSKTILVPAWRPPGRQAFTCAHELGHWYFGHGTRVDISEDDGRLDDQHSPEERLVNAFAAHLLMPLRAVRDSFRRRGWNPADSKPIQVYAVACQLGVGYSTLVHHLHTALRLIGPLHAETLLRSTPKKLRAEVLGVEVPAATHLVLVDSAWTRVAVDLRVGDVAILPAGTTLAGKSAEAAGESPSGVLVEAIRPGITQVEVPDASWAAFLRVSRREYTGLSKHRFLEESDDE